MRFNQGAEGVSAVGQCHTKIGELCAQQLHRQRAALFFGVEALKVAVVSRREILQPTHGGGDGVHAVLRGGGEVGEHVDQHLDRLVHLRNASRCLLVQRSGLLAHLLAAQAIKLRARIGHHPRSPARQVEAVQGLKRAAVHRAHALADAVVVVLVDPPRDALAVALQVKARPHAVTLAAIGKAHGGAVGGLVADQPAHGLQRLDDRQRHIAAGLNHSRIGGDEAIALVVPPSHSLGMGITRAAIKVSIVREVGDPRVPGGAGFPGSGVSEQKARQCPVVPVADSLHRRAQLFQARYQGRAVGQVARHVVKVGAAGDNPAQWITPARRGIGRATETVARVALYQRADDERRGNDCEAGQRSGGTGERASAGCPPATVSSHECAKPITAKCADHVPISQRAGSGTRPRSHPIRNKRTEVKNRIAVRRTAQNSTGATALPAAQCLRHHVNRLAGEAGADMDDPALDGHLVQHVEHGCFQRLPQPLEGAGAVFKDVDEDVVRGLIDGLPHVQLRALGFEHLVLLRALADQPVALLQQLDFFLKRSHLARADVVVLKAGELVFFLCDGGVVDFNSAGGDLAGTHAQRLDFLAHALVFFAERIDPLCVLFSQLHAGGALFINGGDQALARFLVGFDALFFGDARLLYSDQFLRSSEGLFLAGLGRAAHTRL